MSFPVLDLASSPVTVTAHAIGERAHAALRACDGVLEVIEGFEHAPYRLAGKEVVWMGTQPAMHRVHHPRAIVLAALPPRDIRRVRVAAPLPAPRREPRLHPGDTTAQQLAAAAETLLARLDDIGAARGFGTTLRGDALEFPLGAVQEKAAAFALACGGRNWTQACAIGHGLLGVGGGLTPSGDDYIGGVLFALRLGMRGDCAAGVDTFASRLCAAAATRTHVISATLLADLAALRGYSAMDELGLAAIDGGIPRLIAAGRALAALGHSSGWDLLTGFIAGATGRLAHPKVAGKPK